MDLLYFILAAHGLTQILVYGTIFNNIRPPTEWLKGLGKLFHCPMCMGFWSGAFLFGINGFTELFTFEYNFANALILSCISSATCYMLSALINDFGFKIFHINGGDLS